MVKVHSVTVSLSDILEKGPYSIPYNQRPYTWSKTNWESLWNSFFLESEKSSFMGSIILLNDSKSQIKQIFDGQQRLTTLQILNKAIIDLLISKNQVKDANDIFRRYVVNWNTEPKIIVNELIRKYFQSNIQVFDTNPEPGITEAEKEIFKAYKFFYNECEKVFDTSASFSEDYINRLLEMEVIAISIQDEILGIEIFESVNHKGESLNAADLAKNIIMKYARSIPTPIQPQEVHNTWTEINERLQNSGYNFIEFLHYYWMANYKYVGRAGLFKALKKEFKNDGGKWMAFFKSINESSQTFENILTSHDYISFKKCYPKANPNKIIYSKYIRSLEALTFIKNKSWILPIFSLFDYEAEINKKDESFISSDKFHHLINKFFVFNFIHFNLLSLPTRDFTPMCYRLAQAINNSKRNHPQNSKKSSDEIRNYFSQFWNKKKINWKGVVKTEINNYINISINDFPNKKDEFIDGFRKIRKTQTNSKYIFHILGIIEFNETGLFPDYNQMTFEHYMPQNPEKSWAINKTLGRKHQDKLGNILLLDSKTNNSINNDNHIKKMESIKKSGSASYFLNRTFIEEHDKNNGNYNFDNLTEKQLVESSIDKPSEIDKRTDWIAERLFKIMVEEMKY